MRIIILASGSGGNCCYVGEGRRGILIDTGISRRRILTGLKSFNIDPAGIAGIFITHEHADHMRGLEMLCKYEKYPVYASAGTIDRLSGRLPKADFRSLFLETRVNGFGIYALPIPHDAEEPLGFAIEYNSCRLLVATDMGYVTGRVLNEISRCNGLIFESNHDTEMLINGPYPEDLKRRILSRWGHLSNTQCAAALKEAAGSGLKFVVLAHLSKENNLPEIALGETAGALAETVKLTTANRTNPTGPFIL